MEQLTWAAVGAGNALRMHYNAMKEYPELGERYRLVGIADINGYHANKLFRELRISRKEVRLFSGESSAERMLDEVRPQVVSICTPPHTHTLLTFMLMERGIYPVIESPFTVTYGEAMGVIERAKTCNTPLVVMYEHGLDDGFLSAVEARDRNLFGDRIDTIFGSVPWKRGEDYYRKAPWRMSIRENGGGCESNQGKHVLYLMCKLMGPPLAVQAVKAERRRHAYMEGPDTVDMDILWGSGATGRFYCTTARGREKDEWLMLGGPGDTPARMVLYGTYSRPVFADLIGEINLQRQRHPLQATLDATGAAGDAMSVQTSSHARTFYNFYRAVTESGQHMWLPEAELAADTTRTMNAFHQSAMQGGAPVPLGNIDAGWHLNSDLLRKCVGGLEYKGRTVMIPGMQAPLPQG